MTRGSQRPRRPLSHLCCFRKTDSTLTIPHPATHIHGIDRIFFPGMAIPHPGLAPHFLCNRFFANCISCLSHFHSSVAIGPFA